jgi:hypothetical protein
MSHDHGTGRRMAVAAAALLLGGVASAHAALTTQSCLAKKVKEWGELRNCQAKENGKALQGKDADPAKCQTKFDEKLAKLTAQATEAAIPCRYGVNGDGTATDYDTGRQWEQKTDDGTTVHDKDNLYTWNTALGGTTPNGTAFTNFLGTLNNGTSGDGTATSGCFAGHCDWRLPAIEELAGILDLSAPGCSTFTGPCIDQSVFGPTVAGGYWSATTTSGDPGLAWGVNFFNGGVGTGLKDFDLHVRGVRSGL